METRQDSIPNNLATLIENEYDLAICIEYSHLMLFSYSWENEKQLQTFSANSLSTT